MKLEYEIFLQQNIKRFLQKVLNLLHFGSWQNCMSPANVVTEIFWKRWSERALSTGERCNCEYVIFFQSLVPVTLNI